MSARSVPPLLQSSSQPRRWTAHVASFVVGRWCVRGACARVCSRGEACRERKRKECWPTKRDRSPEQERSCVRAARLGYPIAVLFLWWARNGSCDSSPVQRRQRRAHVRAQTAVLVPAAACGNGAAAMQLRARARARTAAAVLEAARGDASASSRRRRADQAKAREQDTRLLDPMLKIPAVVLSVRARTLPRNFIDEIATPR